MKNVEVMMTIRVKSVCVCLFFFFYLRSRTYALVRFPLKVKYKDVVQAESITAGER